MKTQIKVVEISRLKDFANPHYLDYSSEDDAARMLLTLNGMNAKYEAVAYVNPELYGGTVFIRFFIEPDSNTIKHGYEIHSVYEYWKHNINTDGKKRAEFKSYVEDISDLFNLGGGFKSVEELDVVY
jgi:hypothetical protein